MNGSYRRSGLPLTALLFGALTMLAQILMLRAALASLEDNELLLTLFYAAWFGGIFLGAWFGGRHALTGERARAVTPGLLAAQSILLPLALLSIRAIRPALGLPAAEPVPFLPLALIVWGFVAPFSVATGAAFPLLCRCGEEDGPARGGGGGSVLGSVYGWEALGAMLTGAGFTLAPPPRWGTLPVAIWAAAIVTLNATVLTGRLQPARRPRRILPFAGASLILLALALPPASRRIEAWATARWWSAYGSGLTLRATAETRQQSLALASQSGQSSLLCNGRFALSFPDPVSAARTAGLMLAERPRPRRILLIGGLGRGLAERWLAAGVERIDLAESDPGLMAFLLPVLPPDERRALNGPRVRLQTVDGRRWLKQRAASAGGVGERYDLIVCLTPDPATLALNRFYTREFFEEARAALEPQGVLAIRLGSAVNYFGAEISGLIGSVDRALCEVFPGAVATPGTEMFLFASPDRRQPTADAAMLTARWNAMGLAMEGFSPLAFQTIFEPGQMPFLERNRARMRAGAAANTDARPVSYFAALRVWARTSGSALGWLFRIEPLIGPRSIAAAIALLLIAWRTGAGRWRRDPAARASARALVAIATAGTAGFGVSLVLLLSFQARLGYLYHAIGLLNALFMAGLCAGALAGRLGERRPGAALAVCELIWAGLLAMMAWALTTRSSGQSFAVQAVAIGGGMLLTGMASGAQFVIAGHLYRRSAPEPGRAAARINAADHLGACAGALLTGLVLLPAVGMVGALGTFAALKAAGAWMCLWPARDDGSPLCPPRQ